MYQPPHRGRCWVFSDLLLWTPVNGANRSMRSNITNQNHGSAAFRNASITFRHFCTSIGTNPRLVTGALLIGIRGRKQKGIGGVGGRLLRVRTMPSGRRGAAFRPSYFVSVMRSGYVSQRPPRGLSRLRIHRNESAPWWTLVRQVRERAAAPVLERGVAGKPNRALRRLVWSVKAEGVNHSGFGHRASGLRRLS